jgi:drug/metabolite transporter (DMT)-like permease
MEKYLYIGSTLALTVYAQLVLKERALAHASKEAGRKIEYLLSMYSDVGVLSGLGAGVVAAVCWTLALEKTSLSLAYPFMALSFVVVPVGAALLFDERLTLTQLLGLILIVVGIVTHAVAS